MPRGDKSKYTDKQKRMAGHIEESYEKRGLDADEAASRAWAAVNAKDHGGKKSGSGRAKPRKAARTASTPRTPAERSASAKMGAATRRRNAEKEAAGKVKPR